MRFEVVGGFLILALACAPPVLAQSGVSDPALAEAQRQLKDGSFEEAVLTLDAVARRLRADPDQTEQFVQACVYLGVAYVGLNQEMTAKGKFRQALTRDEDLRLDTGQFSPGVIRVFEAARQEQQARVAEPQGGGSNASLLLVGLGAGAAGAAAGAASKKTEEPPNNRPAAFLSITPAGQAISGVTRMTFTASASDPENDPLTYEWDLGDGSSGSGQTVTHVYEVEGSFTVSLTVTDSHGGTATATGSVTGRTLTGAWVSSNEVDGAQSTYTLIQQGTALDGQYSFRWTTCPLTGTVTDPRTVTFVKQDCVEYYLSEDWTYSGILYSQLEVIAGTYTSPSSSFQRTFALSRQ